MVDFEAERHGGGWLVQMIFRISIRDDFWFQMLIFRGVMDFEQCFFSKWLAIFGYLIFCHFTKN